MAITNTYIVRYLLAATREPGSPLRWQTDANGASNTQTHGVGISLFLSHTMGGSALCLCFNRGSNVIYIEEPRLVTLFSRKYRDEDERLLAEALQELAVAVSAQIRAERANAWDLKDSIRETLYRQVLFGE